ncbi:acyltransferase family protein [Flexivirga oryzae]|uniref:Peptidoglycan/LPS O-acetylase OafA/YrhL n=1 Tax=Flexivirga oryzae TaxID=1794944 RepID=A0A839N9F0_9MICO|nr:acyltransferase [Flexivirga oryzae]MBB2891361.1 peptidoglycan/LPS O-acetylase OafA/YrhL [Flexivirga oryzae]
MRGGSLVTRRLAALDGIRGVLVIFLLCFHFGFTQLQGAWLTLNVFFVLSGFLIVRLLVQERARTGRISFVAFYARRARRLFPALALLLATVVIYGFLFASDQVRGPLRWDVLATMGYFMNWRLIAQSNQYFVQFSEPSVLQHAWSLSVEEQFYLVIPALILLLMAVLRTRRALIATLAGLALVSAGWMAVVGVGSDVARSHLYYGTDTRAQSLLMGAALGVLAARFGAVERPSPLPVKHVQAVGWAAFALTVASFVLAVPQTPLMADGGMFVLSLVAVAWVWAVSDERAGPLQRVLAVPPLAALGRISYGVYLWHWPIGLWLGQLMPDEPTWVRVVVGFVLTIGVATISYQRVERPIHDLGWRAVVGTPLRARTIAAGTAAALFFGAIGVGVGAPAATGVGAPGTTGKVVRLVPGQPPFHRPAKPYTIALYGDSVPYLLVQNFPKGDFPGVRAASVAVPGCDLLDQPWIDPRNGAEPNIGSCKKFKQDIPGHIAAAHANLLIIIPGALLGFRHEFDGKALWWGDPKYEKAIRSKLDTITRAAKAVGTDVAIVTQTCRSDKATGLGQLVDAVRQNDPIVLKELESASHENTFLRRWANDERVPIADLHKAVCPTGVPRSIPGTPIFGDGVHFSPQFTPSVWAFLIAELGKGR